MADRDARAGGLDREQLLAAYRTMRTIREFEERVHQEFAAGEIPGAVHLYAGQEAVATGVCAALAEGDYIASTHRGHGHAIAKGCDLTGMMLEIYGKAGGLCGGKGGSMHIADFDRGMLGANGIAAGGVPLACGAALSAKLRDSGQVAVAFVGDGGANQGAFAESLTLAAVWHLPVVFVVEDNDWAISVPRDASTCIPSNADRAAAYGIPGERIDDNDVEAIYASAGTAVGRARAGEGPTLLEIHTLRLWGHFEGDPQAYRPELDDVPGQDPIPAYEQRLTQDGVLDADAAKAIKDEASARVEKAVEFAKSSPVPAPETALEYVFK